MSYESALLVDIRSFLLGFWESVGALGVGTFLGAYLAFYFERVHTEKNERNARHAALLKAQFSIISMLSCARGIKLQALDVLRSDAHRDTLLLPQAVYSKMPRIDVESLTFLLKETEGVEILQQIMTAESVFDTMIGVLVARNECHEQIQNVVATGGAQAVDVAKQTKLKDLTDALYMHNDDVHQKTEAICIRLFAYIKRAFPGALALRFAEKTVEA